MSIQTKNNIELTTIRTTDVSEDTPLVGKRNVCQRVSKFVTQHLKGIGCAVLALLLLGGGGIGIHLANKNDGCPNGQRYGLMEIDPIHSECSCVSSNSTLPKC